MKKARKVLGIESSCDETSASVVRGPDKILSNVVASSLKKHARYGGVIPEIAARAHVASIVPVVQEALAVARVQPCDIDAVAVTEGPGLIGSLLVGRSFARGLADAWERPLIGIDHVRAHLYAAFIGERIRYPFVGLVVSGGHTSLYRVQGPGEERLCGATRDDAAGEAFDKVAKILGLSYPGGPAVEAMALKGRVNAVALRCGCGSGTEFSFSGIKTAVLYKAKEMMRHSRRLDLRGVRDLCASFQETVVSDLVAKAVSACRQARARDLAVGGGVAFNERLRGALSEGCRGAGLRLHIAAKEYCLDNAAMVASLAARMM